MMGKSRLQAFRMFGLRLPAGLHRVGGSRSPHRKAREAVSDRVPLLIDPAGPLLGSKYPVKGK